MYSTCKICIFNKQVVIGHCEQLLSSSIYNLTSSRKLVVFWYNCNTRNYRRVKFIYYMPHHIVTRIFESYHDTFYIILSSSITNCNRDTHCPGVPADSTNISSKRAFLRNLTKCFEEAIPNSKKMMFWGASSHQVPSFVTQLPKANERKCKLKLPKDKQE